MGSAVVSSGKGRDKGRDNGQVVVARGSRCRMLCATQCVTKGDGSANVVSVCVRSSLLINAAWCVHRLNDSAIDVLLYAVWSGQVG
jgi:hypothetical protein